MNVARRRLIVLAAGGSALMMLGALGFQYLGDLPPCKLCYWQRYPHVAAVAIGLAAVLLPVAGLALLGALAALSTAAIGAYHTGVERGWWDGPSACSGNGESLSGMSGADLLSVESAAPVIMCDEVTWQMLGLSMASWNALASLGLAALWTMAARARR